MFYCYQDQAVTCKASKLWVRTEPAAVSQAQTTWWASGACHCLGPSLRRHLVRLHWPASVTEGWKLHSSRTASLPASPKRRWQSIRRTHTTAYLQIKRSLTVLCACVRGAPCPLESRAAQAAQHPRVAWRAHAPGSNRRPWGNTAARRAGSSCRVAGTGAEQ